MNTTTSKNLGRLSRFCFTLNNYSTADEELLKTLASQMKMKWMIFGKEHGEQNGTPHLQGACLLGRQVAFSTLKKKFPSGTHIEVMKGTPQDSLAYCTKEDKNAFQFGSLPEPGKRNDLMEAIQTVKTGKPLSELIRANDQFASIFLKYSRGLTSLRGHYLLGRDPTKPPEVYWIHGATGTGKTRSAFEYLCKRVGSEEVWMSSGSLRWFDGYEGHKAVILDDIRADSIQYNQLLRILDRYPTRVEYKGGSVQWVPEVIIITAPMGPEQFFRPGDDIEQLQRRISRVIEFKPGSNTNLAQYVLTRPNTPISTPSVSEEEPKGDVLELQQTLSEERKPELSLLSRRRGDHCISLSTSCMDEVHDLPQTQIYFTSAANSSEESEDSNENTIIDLTLLSSSE